MKKYELTREFVEIDGVKLYRIKALKDFGTSHTIHKDDEGGKIAKQVKSFAKANDIDCG